jgi:hypothetical protein
MNFVVVFRLYANCQGRLCRHLEPRKVYIFPGIFKNILPAQYRRLMQSSF